MNLFLRLIFLPFGCIKVLFKMGVEGSRDIVNKIRYPNAIIDEGCAINKKVEIGSKSRILANTLINNSTIGKYSYIGKSCILQNVSIGSFCSIASEVLIGLGKHPENYFSTSTLFYRTENCMKVKLIEKDLDFEEYERIEIGNDVWIGTRAIILDGVKIGNGAIIAANSVVTKDVEPYSIMGGVPAREIRKRFGKEKIEKLLKSEWWNIDVHDIQKKIQTLNQL
jgi:chloramphenicol O-acetyltransferase type B